MNPESQQFQPQESVNNPLSAMGVGEANIFEVRPHPFGMFGIYVTLVMLLVLIGAGVIAAPSVLTDYSRSTVQAIGLLVFAVVGLLVAGFAWIAHIVYYGNRWILTTDSLTQVKQNSLFDKQNSQLSLGNLEDITARQDGILAHIFNFGLLKVETAGEHSKFSFPYCPNPNLYAQKILQAREAFEQGEGYKGRTNSGTPERPTGINTNTQQ